MSLGLFQKLPTELLAEVGGFLPLTDCRNLSTTNKAWRQVLVPYIFAKLRITSKQEDQESISSVLEKYSRYTHQLYFECYLYPNEQSDSLYSYEDGPRVSNLPDLVCNLLVGDGFPPKCHSLTVGFEPENNFDGWGWGDDVGSIYFHTDPEDEDRTAGLEHDVQWRSNIRHLWELVATNKHIHHLAVNNLPPRATSTWFTVEWRAFLNQLEEMSIGIWAGDNGAGWQSNTTEGYHDFFENLGVYFFEHAKSLKRLSIKPDEDNPYGGEAGNLTPLALKPRDMPNLESLYLRNCCFDGALIAFLEAHAQVLKRMHLQQCMCASEANLTWADFFKSIRQKEPILEDLQVIITEAPLSDLEEFPEDGPFAPPEDEPEEIKNIRKAVAEEGRKVFPYIDVDGKYGMLFHVEEENVERFQNGEDQREYDSLMELVQRNAEARNRR